MTSDYWKDRRILIPGINGFAGSWLAEKLLERNGDIAIFGLKRKDSSLEKIAHIKKKITLLNGDILDSNSVFSVLKESEPDVVFHLAAQALAKRSYEEPFKTFSLNFTGTLNVFEAMRRYEDDLGKIHFASSANVYGNVKPDEVPIKETQELRPIEMYGISKASADCLCRHYSNAYGMPVVVTRAFHHEGPRCHDDVIGMQIVNQISDAIQGLTGTLFFGNMGVVRDFNDVRDIVNGYILAAENGRNGEVYNLCGGRGYKIVDLINQLIEEFKLNQVKIEIDQKRLRKNDVPVLIGDNSKAVEELGWKPDRDFKDTLVELINDKVKTI